MHTDFLTIIKNPKSVTEKNKKAVNSWWRAFSENEEKLNSYFSGTLDNHFDLVAWIQDNLQSIDDNLMWEFGAGIQKKHRLIITPEANRQLRPLVRYILHTAPDLKNFEFCQYRPLVDLNQAKKMMLSRTGWDDFECVGFDLDINDTNKINIQFFTSDMEHNENRLNQLFVLLECLLGEEILEKWIGYIDIEKQETKKSIFSKETKSAKKHFPISQLNAEVEKTIQMVKSNLPQNPYCEIIDDLEWVLRESSPPHHEDYSFKDDMFVIPFINIKSMFEAMHSHKDSFSSDCFSNNNEKFIYLKIDGTAEDLNQEVFKDKSEIEDRLNKALIGLGCCIGGGTGYRYSYLDLAVKNFDKALPIIQKTLQEGLLTKKSWLFFHDPDYQNEWIGVWPDSPQPFLL